MLKKHNQKIVIVIAVNDSCSYSWYREAGLQKDAKRFAEVSTARIKEEMKIIAIEIEEKRLNNLGGESND